MKGVLAAFERKGSCEEYGIAGSPQIEMKEAVFGARSPELFILVVFLSATIDRTTAGHETTHEIRVVKAFFGFVRNRLRVRDKSISAGQSPVATPTLAQRGAVQQCTA
jgi:hypothetical protein